jgi:predicted dehydrogenase
VRVAIAGVCHWHMHHYEDVLADLPGVQVVGVSDLSPGIARASGERFECASFTDYREMCAAVKPEFVFALGRHCDMAAEGAFLIDEGIPFSLEKPCGISYAEVRSLADRAASKGAFASATFGFRHTEMYKAIAEIAGRDSLNFVSIRAIGGSPYRYRNFHPAVPWVLDPAQSGGGALINLSIHYLQLFRMLVPGSEVRVLSAVTSNRGYGFAVEDYGALQLEAGGALCHIETGYNYPGPGQDDTFTIRTSGHYFTIPNQTTVRVADVAAIEEVLQRADPDEVKQQNASPDKGGAIQTLTASSNRFPLAWAEDVLARVRDGRPPSEDMADMAACVGLVEDAYRLAGPITPTTTAA